jgi:uncharacterized protein
LKIKLEELDNLEDEEKVINFEEFIKDVDSDEPIKASLTITKTAYGVEVNGKVQSKINFVCDRCLKNFQKEINFEVKESFTKDELNEEYGAEYMITDFSEELNGREELDLTDLVYQCIIVNLPSSNLCDESCTGREDYPVSKNTTDPRLNVFKEISKKMK